MVQWKISGGYDYALLPNRQWNKKNKNIKNSLGAKYNQNLPNEFAWQGRDISRPRQMIDSQYGTTIMGGREVSRPYRVWFFAEGERFFMFFVSVPPEFIHRTEKMAKCVG